MSFPDFLTMFSLTIIHIDEAVRPGDVTLPFDLVGITFHTPSARHVYELACGGRCR
jgi:hypothetical protein